MASSFIFTTTNITIFTKMLQFFNLICHMATKINKDKLDFYQSIYINIEIDILL